MCCAWLQAGFGLLPYRVTTPMSVVVEVNFICSCDGLGEALAQRWAEGRPLPLEYLRLVFFFRETTDTDRDHLGAAHLANSTTGTVRILRLTVSRETMGRMLAHGTLVRDLRPYPYELIPPLTDNDRRWAWISDIQPTDLVRVQVYGNTDPPSPFERGHSRSRSRHCRLGSRPSRDQARGSNPGNPGWP